MKQNFKFLVVLALGAYIGFLATAVADALLKPADPRTPSRACQWAVKQAIVAQAELERTSFEVAVECKGETESRTVVQ